MTDDLQGLTLAGVMAIVDRALEEDAPWGDATSDAAIPASATATARIVSRVEGVFAGGLPLVYHPGLAFRLMTVLTLTTGTTFIMWLGELITDPDRPTSCVGRWGGHRVTIRASVSTSGRSTSPRWWATTNERPATFHSPTPRANVGNSSASGAVSPSIAFVPATSPGGWA